MSTAGALYIMRERIELMPEEPEPEPEPDCPPARVQLIEMLSERSLVALAEACNRLGLRLQ